MSPALAKTEALAMTWDKVTNAHALKDTEERTVKVELEKILLFVNKIMSSRFL